MVEQTCWRTRWRGWQNEASACLDSIQALQVRDKWVSNWKAGLTGSEAGRRVQDGLEEAELALSDRLLGRLAARPADNDWADCPGLKEAGLVAFSILVKAPIQTCQVHSRKLREADVSAGEPERDGKGPG